MNLEVQSRKGCFWTSYLFGALIVLEQMLWVISLVAKWTGSVGLALVPWVLCGLIGGFYFAFLAILVRSALLRNWLWAVPLLWAGTELIRSFIPGLAFPWFLLSTPVGRLPAICQLAYFGTQYFLSAWICLVNVLLLRVLQKHSVKGTYWVFAAAVPVLSLGWYLRPTSTSNVRVAMGQPGVDMAFGDASTREEREGLAVEALVEKAQRSGASLLVLPEGVAGSTSYPPIPPFALPDDLPVLFGGQRGRDPAYQTAFLYDHGHWSFADKTRLVVFGEYVPGRKLFPFLKDFKLAGADLTPSDTVTPVKVAKLTVGPMLCFEGLFYDVAHKQAEKGSQLLACMSIDDWYMGTGAPEQLRDSVAWRAMETGLPIVRSASLGYTEAVDGKGRLLASLPLRDRDDLTVDVPVEQNPLRNPLRPLFPWIVSMFPFAFGLYVMLARRKRN
jgi:apolipoprotein N-acyltransferase